MAQGREYQSLILLRSDGRSGRPWARSHEVTGWAPSHAPGSVIITFGENQVQTSMSC
jgi:hypothetical protein